LEKVRKIDKLLIAIQQAH